MLLRARNAKDCQPPQKLAESREQISRGPADRAAEPTRISGFQGQRMNLRCLQRRSVRAFLRPPREAHACAVGEPAVGGAGGPEGLPQERSGAGRAGAAGPGAGAHRQGQRVGRPRTACGVPAERRRVWVRLSPGGRCEQWGRPAGQGHTGLGSRERGPPLPSRLRREQIPRAGLSAGPLAPAGQVQRWDIQLPVFPTIQGTPMKPFLGWNGKGKKPLPLIHMEHFLLSQTPEITS